MKVTIDQIEAKITDETYLVLPDGRSTLCILTLENGYSVKGLSACVDPAEFNLALGRQYAREDAMNQVWPLEGYLLAQRIHEHKVRTEVQKLFEETKDMSDEEISSAISGLTGKTVLLRRGNDGSKPKNPKKHWTQTPAGKAKMAARKRGAK